MFTASIRPFTALVPFVAGIAALVACSAAPPSAPSADPATPTPTPSATRDAQAPSAAAPDAGPSSLPSVAVADAATGPVAVCSVPAGTTYGLAMARPARDVLYFDSTTLVGGGCIAAGGGCSFSILSCPVDATGATPTTVVHGVQQPANGVAANGIGGFDYQLAVGDPAGGIGSQGIYRYANGKTSHVAKTEGAWKTDLSTGHLFYADSTTATQLDDLKPETVHDAGASPQFACVASGVGTLTDYAAAQGAVFVLDGATSKIVAYAEDATGCAAGSTVATGVSGETVMLAEESGAHVYFADSAGVHACEASSGTCQTLAASQGSVTHMVQDDATLYWTGAAGLVSCTKSGCGGTPRVLVPGLSSDAPIEVDATGASVYYVDQGANGGATLYRVAK